MTEISAVNYPIYPLRTEISFSASFFSLVLSAMVLSKAAIVSAHSYSYLTCSASASAYWVAKSVLISANILATSPKGELADNYKAMVSKSFFPKDMSSKDFNWVKTLNPALAGFFKNTALVKAMLRMSKRAKALVI